MFQTCYQLRGSYFTNLVIVDIFIESVPYSKCISHCWGIFGKYLLFFYFLLLYCAFFLSVFYFYCCFTSQQGVSTQSLKLKLKLESSNSFFSVAGSEQQSFTPNWRSGRYGTWAPSTLRSKYRSRIYQQRRSTPCAPAPLAPLRAAPSCSRSPYSLQRDGRSREQHFGSQQPSDGQ